MNRTIITALAMAGAFALVPAAATAGTVYNSTPADGWFFGHGNDYSPANTAVLTDGDNQIYLRMHKNGIAAPASDNHGVYSFALGTQPINFDYGVDSATGSFDGVTALITLTNLGTHTSTSFDLLTSSDIDDNEFLSGSVQNSERLNWDWIPIGFDAGINDTYRVSLTVTGLGQSPQSLTVYAKLGDGAGAVPEPASWAMMLGGFGLVGGAMRRRKAQVALA
jgi:hypothetical protein